MIKFVGRLILGFTLMVVVAGSAAAAGADNVGTFGQCIAGAPVELRHYQAPGQTGNGPLVIHQDGSVSYPPAFEGGAGGCSVPNN